MRKTYIAISLFAVFSTNTFAFPCYLTLAKDNCWTNYEVNMQIVDTTNYSVVATIKVPKGKSWNRVQFSCKANQTFLYKATFSPTIWQDQEKKVYTSTEYWSTPSTPGLQDKAWLITVCFPKAFSQVPISGEAKQSCECDFDTIPAPTMIKN